tara:strand:- start:1233 stop:1367 length:135 start_codon:yes stop_codon:yes gene_type:complete
MQLSKNSEKMLIEISRKKGMKSDEYLLGLLLEQYQHTFKRPYRL